MEKQEIIVVGAGAAGLIAAYHLSKSGKRVTILEARERIGGRIYSLNDPTLGYAESGAEFIHSDLTLTKQLLSEAGIGFSPSGGEMWEAYGGQLRQSNWNIEGWDELMEALNHLQKDVSIAEFLQEYFGDEKYAQMREAVIRFVSGYDTADPARASAFALRLEWQQDDEGAQYRIKGGYGELMAFLEKQCKSNGVNFQLEKVVKHIEWTSEQVRLTTADKNGYLAEKVIIALPLGVLKAGIDQPASVVFEPGLMDHSLAIQQMGYGAIIKVLLRFKSDFWNSAKTAKIGFILSGEAIPTWWTQYPAASNLLTGWLGGLPAEAKKHLDENQLLELAIGSLANIFNKPETELCEELVAWKVVNWTTDPYTLGSYAYDTVESHRVRILMQRPVAQKLYFAGEYLYEGPAMGTVEAALASGLAVAQQIS